MKRILAALVASLAVASFASHAQEAPKPAPAPAEKPVEKAADAGPMDAVAGKYKVATLNDLKLKDEERKRELSLSVIYPEGEGKFPVVLYSSQAGVNQLDLPTFWASHGYVVILPLHADAQPSRAAQTQAMVDRLFEQMDADKDGKLSAEEIPEMLKDRVKDADTDGDGFISKEELAKVFANGMGGRGGRGGRGGNGGQPGQPGEPAPAPAPAPKDPKAPKEDDFDIHGDARDSLLEDPAQPQPQPQPGPGQGRGQGRGGQGRGMGGAPETLDAGVDHVKDFALVLAQIEKLGELAPALKGKLDLEHVAAAGHGFGSYTAAVIGGATVDLSAEKKAQSFADKRIKSVIELSSRGTGQLGLTKESFAALKLPVLTMTGSEDKNPADEKQGPEWKREAFQYAPEGGKIHLVITGARAQNLVSEGGGFGRGGAQPATEDQKKMFSWTKLATLNFLNSTLRADEAAAKWFDAETLKKNTDGKLAIEKK